MFYHTSKSSVQEDILNMSQEIINLWINKWNFI